MNKLGNNLFNSVVILFNGLFAAIHFSEWYNVQIQHRTAEYPFGGEGPTPYFYKTAQLYSTVNLFWGFTFLLVFAFTFWTIITKKKKGITMALASALVLLVELFVQAWLA